MEACQESACSDDEDELLDWQGDIDMIEDDTHPVCNADMDKIAAGNHTTRSSARVVGAGISPRHGLYPMDPHSSIAVVTKNGRFYSSATVGTSIDDDCHGTGCDIAISNRRYREAGPRTGGGGGRGNVADRKTAAIPVGTTMAPPIIRDRPTGSVLCDIMSEFGKMLSPRFMGRVGQVPSTWTLQELEEK